MKELIKNLEYLIFPPLCACCGDLLVRGEVTICTACRVDMPLTRYWETEQNYCVELLAGRFPFRQASALMYFRANTDFQTIIHKLKYGGRSDVAFSLGELYGYFLSQCPHYQGIELIIPLPLHWTKLSKRGYNQSEQFARGIARSMGVKVMASAIKRSRKTHVQAQMHGTEQRAHNVEGAFEVKKGSKLDGHKILLVDDVITTGATIESCANVIAAAYPSAQINIGALAIVKSTKYIKAFPTSQELSDMNAY